MSEEMAAKKEADEQAVKTAQEQAAQEAQKRLWMVMLILDPETGEFMIQPNANVKKQWQLDSLLAAANKQNDLTANAKVTGDLIVKVMEAKKGKGLFRG